MRWCRYQSSTDPLARGELCVDCSLTGCRPLLYQLHTFTGKEERVQPEVAASIRFVGPRRYRASSLFSVNAVTSFRRTHAQTFVQIGVDIGSADSTECRVHKSQHIRPFTLRSVASPLWTEATGHFVELLPAVVLCWMALYLETVVVAMRRHERSDVRITLLFGRPMSDILFENVNTFIIVQIWSFETNSP